MPQLALIAAVVLLAVSAWRAYKTREASAIYYAVAALVVYVVLNGVL